MEQWKSHDTFACKCEMTCVSIILLNPKLTRMLPCLFAMPEKECAYYPIGDFPQSTYLYRCYLVFVFSIFGADVRSYVLLSSYYQATTATNSNHASNFVHLCIKYMHALRQVGRSAGMNPDLGMASIPSLTMDYLQRRRPFALFVIKAEP